MRFCVLGPVVAYGIHGAVELGPTRQRTVLATLLVEPATAVNVDQLIDRVWGERPPQRARQTLHTYLSRLRTLLEAAGGPAPVRSGRGYLLGVDPVIVDIHEFRDLVARARAADDAKAVELWRDALALWRGTPFDDVDSDWLHAVADGLERERWAAILDRNDVLLRSGNHTNVLADVTSALNAHPLDERLAGQFMVALYAAGRQADALAHYRTLRQRLVDDIGSEPGPALRELHRRILHQDPHLVPGKTAPETPRKRAPAAPVTGPRIGAPTQLPADIAGFTGRDDAVKQLDDILDSAGDPRSATVIATIGGSGGIGKTALAVHWAHRVRGRFPDGQLYLNLRGFDPGGQPMPSDAALRTLLELLGVSPAKHPTTIEALAGLYRSQLADARMLLLLDNARDAEQVRPLLLGSPGSMVLVTSRSDLASLVATEGARPLWLDGLDADRARLLLARRLGPDRLAAEPDAVDTVITACAGLPLALAIIAARAATRPTLPLSALAAELADAGNPLDAFTGPDAATDVRAVFSWSYHALGAESARLLRLLGLHPGPDIGPAAAASLACLPIPQTRRLLDMLCAAHLLTEHTPGRYAFHDLIRAYAAELAYAEDSEDDRFAAQRRMLDYYLLSAHATDQWLPAARDPISPAPPSPGVVVKVFTDNTGARQWLTEELAVLLAVVHSTTDARFDRHIQQLGWSMATFLLWRGHWHHQVSVQEAALRAARRLGDQPGQADIHRRLLYAHLMLGRSDQAQGHSLQAIDLYAAVGDHTGSARTHLGLMWFSEQQGNHHDALHHALQALEFAERSGNRGVLAVAYNGVGWTHSLVGEHETAIAYCERALPILEELGERATMADVWDSLGHAYHQLGRHPEAISYYQRARDQSREMGDRRHEASHLARLGDTHSSAGDHEAARQSWRAALTIFDDIDHPEAASIRSKLATTE
ncbi:tetratricopeptide repeat protein [Micromonospora sp. KC606]|nr:tetratricopeptide repeat protein [Micromonospora sp. KC606]